MSFGTSRPPEESLAVPPCVVESPDRIWALVAYNRSVNENWKAFIECEPASAARWYRYLSAQAMTPYPRRVFPLKGSDYPDAWECEISGGCRLYYTPNENTHKVVVYYVGRHPKRAPKPP